MSRTGFIVSVRVKELRRLFDDRYPFGLSNDDAGRDDVELMLCHLAQLSNAPFAVDNFLDAKAPWMAAGEREAAKQLAATGNRCFTADELAVRLGLTYADRCRLGITTIGAIDKDARQREEIQREKHRERARQRRRAERRQMRRRPPVSERSMVVFLEMPPHGWHAVSCLQDELLGHKAFAGVSKSSMRKVIARAFKELEAQLLIRTETRPGQRGLPVLFATRDERTARQTVPGDSDGDKVPCEALK
jgi:hypothetical protein